MLDSKLHDFDDSRGRSRRGYQPRAAALLQEASSSLKRATTVPDAYFHVIECALRALDLPMGLHQRLFAFHLLGSACLGGGAFQNGIDYLELALDLAEELDDLPIQVELAYLLGVAMHNAALFSAAASYLMLALSKLDRLQEDIGPANLALKLSLHIGLGQCHYNLEDYGRALDHLTLVRALATSPQFDVQRATGDLATALVWRWRNAPEQGLGYALRAAEAFERDTSRATASSSGRIQAIAADIMLDLAERYSPDPPHDARTVWVRKAQPYVQGALTRTHLAEDRMGEGIARLARIRWERLAGWHTERESKIHSVIRLARREHDAPLLAQAYMAMGMELAAQGHDEQARNCFRKTLDVVGPSEAPAMGHWARVALVKGLLSDVN